MLLDTSTSMGNTYNADVIPATLSFLKKLPPGATFSIWSTSDSPKVIVEQGERRFQRSKPRSAMSRRLVTTPRSTALVAASQELAKDDTHRPAAVLVTSASMAGVAADMQALLPKASLKPTYVAIQYIQGPEDTRLQDALQSAGLTHRRNP